MARRLRVYVPALRAGRLELERDAAHYVATVHRLREGDEFVAFDPEHAQDAVARVTSVTRGRVECELREPRPAERRGYGVTLYQALAKGDRVEQVVRAGTALGVSVFVLLHSERSIGAAASPRRERLRQIAIEAARQSGRGDLPQIEGPLSFAESLRGQAPSSALKFCLSPRAQQSLSERLEQWSPPSPASLLIGPEGGFSAEEDEAAEAAGFVPASLGPLTLRAELAATVALGCFAVRVPAVAETV